MLSCALITIHEQRRNAVLVLDITSLIKPMVRMRRGNNLFSPNRIDL